MLGMHSSLMSCNGSFDLVGVPAIAFSLDNHQARKEEDFEISAQISVALMRVSGQGHTA
ncbi:SurE domain-containing protein, partial [Haematococcus lacustris]